MNHTDKKHHLLQLDEKSFRRNVVLPLLSRLPGVTNVTDNHGAQELGIDVIYFYPDPMGTDACVGIQLKVGNINVATGKSSTDDVGTLEKQITLASRNEVALVNPVGSFRISKFQIMTTGNISSGAKTHLMKFARDEFRLNLEFKEGDNVIELLDRFYPDYWQYLNKTLSAYYASLREKYSRIDDITKLGAKQAPLIDDIYVPLTVTEAIDDESLELVEERKDIEEQETVLPVTKRETLGDVELLDENAKKIFIIGESGSGKRVLLRQLLFEQLRRNEKDTLGGVLPFLIDAKNVAASNEPLLTSLEKYLEEHEGSQIKEELSDYLVKKGIIIFVDKLSRINGSINVVEMIEKLNEFTNLYPKTRCVVPIRETQLSELAEQVSFKRYKLDYFGPTQVSALVDKWFSSNEHMNDSSLDVVAQQLIKNVSQGSLPRTPLVYTLNLILLDNEDSKNSNIADLFDKYVDIFLGKWNEELRTNFKFAFKQKKRFLSELAFEMQNLGVESIPREDVLAFFASKFDYMGIDGNTEELLEEMKVGGVLTEEYSNIRFTLYVLQEFFTGIALREHHTEETVVEKLDDRFWGQAIVFYAGLKRECNMLLEHIVTTKETDNFVIQSYRSYMAGMLASNADQSEGALKKEAIRTALLGQVLTLRRLAFIMRQIYGQVGELYAGNFIDLFSFYSMGSPLLERQYKELLEESDSIFEHLDKQEIVVSETESVLPRYLLTSMLLRFGMSGHMEEVQKLVSQPNPYILWLLHIRLNDFVGKRIERTAGQDSDVALRSIRGLRTKLMSKLRNRKYWEANRKLLQKDRKKTKEAYLLPPAEFVLAQPLKYMTVEENQLPDDERESD